MLGAETITVRRPSTSRDWRGDPAGAATEHDIDGCLLAPLSTTETTFQHEQVTDGFTVYVAGTVDPDVQPTDQVVARGGVYEVDGAVRPWAAAGAEFNIVRTRG